MVPEVGGDIDQAYLSRYDATVNAALSSSSSPYVIVDMVSCPSQVSRLIAVTSELTINTRKHNYARRENKIIGQGDGPSIANFTNAWWKLADHYKDEEKIIVSLQTNLV